LKTSMVKINLKKGVSCVHSSDLKFSSNDRARW
jgi:hypothetical protein